MRGACSSSGILLLVHCRSVLVHLTDPLAGIHEWLTQSHLAGCLVIEESDVGLLAMSGIPGLVRNLGLEAFGADAVTGIGSPGDPAYDAMRLARPDTRHAAATVGIQEADLACLDEAFESAANLMVVMTLFGAWGRKPRPSL